MIFTPNQIALLLIALVLGIVLGAMFSGGGKYKRLWREEQRARQQEIREREEIAAAAERRRAAEPPLPTRHAAPPVAGDMEVRRDDLTRIRTVSALDQRTLNEAGYHSYDQIADMSDEQQASLEARLGRRPGSIAHDQWREQARQLATDTSR